MGLRLKRALMYNIAYQPQNSTMVGTSSQAQGLWPLGEQINRRGKGTSPRAGQAWMQHLCQQVALEALELLPESQSSLTHMRGRRFYRSH